MGSVRALVVVEGDPAPDADESLRRDFLGVQVGAFTRLGPPEALYQDVVDAVPFRETCCRPPQTVASLSRYAELDANPPAAVVDSCSCRCPCGDGFFASRSLGGRYNTSGICDVWW